MFRRLGDVHDGQAHFDDAVTLGHRDVIPRLKKSRADCGCSRLETDITRFSDGGSTRPDFSLFNMRTCIGVT
jgi:hypothetical protein